MVRDNASRSMLGKYVRAWKTDAGARTVKYEDGGLRMAGCPLKAKYFLCLRQTHAQGGRGNFKNFLKINLRFGKCVRGFGVGRRRVVH